MVYQVKGDEGRLLDARAELDATSITLQSRGGSTARGAVNVEYAPALRLILKRIAEASIPVERAIVDSYDERETPIDERTILWPGELETDSASAFRIMSSRMRSVGQEEGSKGGNTTKRVRIMFDRETALPDLERVLGLVKVDKQGRLPSEQLEKVTAENVWNALDELGDRAFVDPFGPSTDFDLVTSEGKRYAPKAVFGVAATEALGFDVLPKHFSAGLGTPCFRILQRAGYSIVPKNERVPDLNIPSTPEDREWAEGNPKLVTHLRRERRPEAAIAKKADFIRSHGRLKCEECEMDPVEKYGGDEGVACIEVHHRTIAVADMDPSHRTKLDDLQCVCASCHRVIHRRLKSKLVPNLAVGP